MSSADQLARRREGLFGPPTFDNPRLSPDGNRVAWLAPVDGVPQVWVGGVDDPDRSGRPVTSAAWPVRFQTWAPDGRGVLHIGDPTGAEVWQVLLATDGGTPMAVTPEGRHADLLARQ